MSKSFNKTITLIAMLLLATKSKAQEPAQINDATVYAALVEIQKAAAAQPDFLDSVNDMQKAQLEEQLQMSLTDDEFNSIHALIIQMLNEGIDIKVVHPGKMIPATQEVIR